MALDALRAGFGKEPLHFVLEFLANQVVFQDGDNKDLVEFWDGLASENPTVNNFRSCCEREDSQGEDSYEEKKALSDWVSPR